VGCLDWWIDLFDVTVTITLGYNSSHTQLLPDNNPSLRSSARWFAAESLRLLLPPSVIFWFHLVPQLKRRNYNCHTPNITALQHIKSSNHTLNLLRISRGYVQPRTQNSVTVTVAPFVFKITPLHGPHGKHRLPSLCMHVYRCVAWQQTSSIYPCFCSARTA
jgi:hypothetical protein